MRIGDCFSGIGGFSLAAEWLWGPGSTAWFSEIDPYASRVLARHWPDVPNLGDIRAIDWTTVEPVDVLTGGFPCQPHSLAGKRQGSNDERDLFDEIIRCAGVLRPRFIVLENVPGLFTSDAGRFFGRVLGAVAALGYDAEWRVLSAADVGAPHKRERVWIVAHASHDGIGRWQQLAQSSEGARDVANAESLSGGPRLRSGDESGRGRRLSGDSGSESDAADALRSGLEGRRAPSGIRAQHADASDPRWWATEPDVGRVAHGVPSRVDRLRCLGNSIVPACALEIFRAIEARTVRAAA